MKSIIALQEMIKIEEKRVSILKRQLSDHESGINKLTYMQKASTERSLEETNLQLEINRKKLDELMASDLKELEEKERFESAIKRRNYYQYQKVRLKRDTTRPNDQKLEAMLIIDELPAGVGIEDDQLIEIAQKSISMGLSSLEEVMELHKNVQKDFDDLLKNCKDEIIGDLGMLNIHIPIVVTQFAILLSNIKENRGENKLPPFSGFPKFEDWWIEELWYTHQAYFGLYKWKSIVSKLCNTTDQINAWEVIFANWVFIKKCINGKGRLGFEYNFAFDTLIKKYADLEEEIIEINLLSMESIINDLTKKEDFNKVKKKHKVDTEYLSFKREKLKYQEK